MSNIEKNIIKLTFIIFAFFSVICVFFIKKNNFIIGLTIGTVISTFKFIITSYNSQKILNSYNTFFVIAFNLFNTVAYLIIIFVLIKKIVLIDITLVIGFFIGVTSIPFAITINAILNSLYITKNLND